MADLDIIDFHTHLLPDGWQLWQAPGSAPDPLWQRVGPKITSVDALLRDSDAAGIARRVVGTPLSMVAAPDADANEVAQRLNDALATTAARHPQRISALATVDAFGGDETAREAERAIVHLGAPGLFLDSAKGSLLLDAPQARPVLTVAAKHGVPVFIHPVNEPSLTKQFAPLGRLGTRIARSTINAATTIALVQGGILEELPELQVVITALGLSALALTGPFGALPEIFAEAPPERRRHVYIDIMPLDPRFIRFVTDLVGTDHVLAGSDWPILERELTAERLTTALSAAGLDEAASQLVAGGNARRLLKLT